MAKSIKEMLKEGLTPEEIFSQAIDAEKELKEEQAKEAVKGEGLTNLVKAYADYYTLKTNKQIKEADLKKIENYFVDIDTLTEVILHIENIDITPSLKTLDRLFKYYL
jgi:hypothetical protein